MSPTVPSTWDPAGPAPSKEQFYKDVYEQVAAVLDPSLPTSANLANVSAVVYWALNDPPVSRQVNWVGFYLNERYYPASSNELLSTSLKPELLLGPFQGRVACTKIKLGVGVCGTAAAEKKTVIVPNVHEFPGHIACDSASESEIVVPLLLRGDDGSVTGVIGVFDFDCLAVNGFDEEDKHGIERIADLVVSSCKWKL
ncbi:GAF domain-like protein [Cladochytrium replicatum]|nr:GAF domain-like protein [Cladochytrium replicatum]